MNQKPMNLKWVDLEPVGLESIDLGSSVRSARQRLWAADVACYYAQQRFSQTGKASDRRIWERRQRETEEVLAAVQEAEQALARHRGQ